MIDCENEVFTFIATMLRKQFPGIDVAGEYIKNPPRFPHVSVVMADNPTVRSRQGSNSREVATMPLFEINVFSNKTEGKKSECKTIANAIDTLLFSKNFTRLAITPVPNMEDATIYRIVSRYQVITDGKQFYRR